MVPPMFSCHVGLAQDSFLLSLWYLLVHCHYIWLYECAVNLPVHHKQSVFDLLDDCVVIYLDDILILSRDEAIHCKALHVMFK